MQNNEIVLVVFTLNNIHLFLVFYRKRIKLYQYGVAASASTTDAATTDATATTASSSSAECGPYGNYLFSSFSLNSECFCSFVLLSVRHYMYCNPETLNTQYFSNVICIQKCYQFL